MIRDIKCEFCTNRATTKFFSSSVCDECDMKIAAEISKQEFEIKLSFKDLKAENNTGS